MSKHVRLLSIAPVFVPLSLAGCDWFRPGGPPEEALVEVSSADVDGATLVVSQRFSVGADPGCAEEPDCNQAFQLLSADTNVVDLPYGETIKFTSTQRLLVQSYPPGEDTARLGMRVVVDGDEKYSDIRQLGPPEEDGARETLFFVYTFGTPTSVGGAGGD